MSELPILFQAEQVRALLAGHKTQTRRLGKLRWKKRDVLWVKENFALEPKSYAGDTVIYRADGKPSSGAWKSSIFMPRWASRITLKVLSVHDEPLQDISESDAVSEGCTVGLRGCDDDFSRGLYRALWESIHGNGSWNLNPTVYVIKFKAIKL